jgi:hypothetical protein
MGQELKLEWESPKTAPQTEEDAENAAQDCQRAREQLMTNVTRGGCGRRCFFISSHSLDTKRIRQA